MKVDPQYAPVGKFFEFKPFYRVPTYQRSYSWETLEVEDFVRDLANCYTKRKFTGAISHFFGQIVTIQENLGGTVGQAKFELVDGQQRIATFTILVVSLIKIYKEILEELDGDISKANEIGILRRRIGELTQRYITFEQEIGQALLPVHVLELSKRDLLYFNNFVGDVNCAATSESHIRIKNAYDIIKAKVDSITKIGNPALIDRLGNLKFIEDILDSDFYIMNMVVSEIANKKEAFTLFQVLNNRGKNLTEGDLLRAETLKILDDYPDNQSIVESFWENILSDEPLITERFLKYIYCSYCGKEPGTNTLFIDFLNKFIPENSLEVIDTPNAEAVRRNIEIVKNEMTTLRKLDRGEWPFHERQPIQRWDRNRLVQLIVSLNHDECLPLLLSVYSVFNHLGFSDLIQILERFVFRYVIICKQYLGNLLKIYYEEAELIRLQKTTYNTQNLLNRLRALQDQADDEMFARRLDDLRYSRDGGNGPIKYFLITLEYYYRWYEEGANNTPICRDKERVYDFIDSTIEHIYPYSAKPEDIQEEIEPLKNSIGNLTILGQDDNKAGANDPFLIKQGNNIFSNSSLRMNVQMIANQAEWSRAVVESRTSELIAMALKIFSI